MKYKYFIKFVEMTRRRVFVPEILQLLSTMFFFTVLPWLQTTWQQHSFFVTDAVFRHYNILFQFL